VKIICGTDFSEPSRTALAVAAALAERTGGSVVVAHANGPVLIPDITGITAGAADQFQRAAGDAVAELALAISSRNVQAHGTLIGFPVHTTLVELAAAEGADLLVVGTHGRGGMGRLLLGSIAERLLRTTTLPVLVVGEDGAALAQVIRTGELLRVAAGVDFSGAANAAVAFVRSALEKALPVELTCVHASSLVSELQRLHGAGGQTLPPSAIHAALHREMEIHLGPPGPRMKFDLRLGHHDADVVLELVAAANSSGANLVALGAWSGHGQRAYVQGSRAVETMRASGRSLLLVPTPAEAAVTRHPSRPARVYAATDFSASGNAAVELAYRVVAPGGTVTLCHVLPDHKDPHVLADAQQRLRRLIPEDARAQHVETVTGTPQAHHAADAIVAGARHASAETLLLGLQSGAQSNSRLGSTATQVLQRAHCRVVIVRA